MINTKHWWNFHTDCLIHLIVVCLKLFRFCIKVHLQVENKKLLKLFIFTFLLIHTAIRTKRQISLFIYFMHQFFSVLGLTSEGFMNENQMLEQKWLPLWNLALNQQSSSLVAGVGLKSVLRLSQPNSPESQCACDKTNIIC